MPVQMAIFVIDASGCRDDAEDVVDLMKACLLDKFVDDTGVLDFQRAGGKGKQARTHAHASTRMGLPITGRGSARARCLYTLVWLLVQLSLPPPLMACCLGRHRLPTLPDKATQLSTYLKQAAACLRSHCEYFSRQKPVISPAGRPAGSRHRPGESWARRPSAAYVWQQPRLSIKQNRNDKPVIVCLCAAGGGQALPGRAGQALPTRMLPQTYHQWLKTRRLLWCDHDDSL